MASGVWLRHAKCGHWACERQQSTPPFRAIRMAPPIPSNPPPHLLFPSLYSSPRPADGLFLLLYATAIYAVKRPMSVTPIDFFLKEHLTNSTSKPRAGTQSKEEKGSLFNQAAGLNCLVICFWMLCCCVVALRRSLGLYPRGATTRDHDPRNV